jgi:predicted nucleic acid-binding protein
MTLAIAHQRGAAVATDDRKARRIANQRFGANFPLLRTTGIMHDWVRLEMLEREAVRAVLGRIQTVAQFRPPNDDPLREWWVTAVT